MIFYLLSCVITFTLIFGISHTPDAREVLHIWSTYILSHIQQLLEQYKIIQNRQISQEDDHINGSLEIIVTEMILPKFEETHRSSELSEEIEGSGNATSGIRGENLLETSQTLAELRATIQKLSSVAESGQITRSQLYDILLQEMLLHDKAMQKDRISSASSSTVESPSTAIIQELVEEEEEGEEEGKAKQQGRGESSRINNTDPQKGMYFGESPLEYIPHRK